VNSKIRSALVFGIVPGIAVFASLQFFGIKHQTLIAVLAGGLGGLLALIINRSLNH
jgi:hypothetical protein